MKQWIALLALAAGCGSAGGAPPAGPRPPGAAPANDPAAIHWTRTAAEHRAVFQQAYAWAEQRLREHAVGRAANTWAVVLDADETVIDNSTYQRERAAVGGAFTPETWSAWVHRREATVLPGAGRFIAQVRSMGGRVVIVTNRTQAECDDTRANFMTLGILVDMMLCRPADTSDKNARFAAVQNGTAMPGVPALEILLWVGDNIQDFPSLTQQVANAADSAFSLFGTRYIVVPNPMYGSWERNPVR